MKTYKIVATNMIKMQNEEFTVLAKSRKEALAKVKATPGYRLLKQGVDTQGLKRNEIFSYMRQGHQPD